MVIYLKSSYYFYDNAPEDERVPVSYPIEVVENFEGELFLHDYKTDEKFTSLKDSSFYVDHGSVYVRFDKSDSLFDAGERKFIATSELKANKIETFASQYNRYFLKSTGWLVALGALLSFTLSLLAWRTRYKVFRRV